MPGYTRKDLPDLLWCGLSEDRAMARFAFEELFFFYYLVYENPLLPLHSQEQAAVEETFAEDLQRILADPAFPSARFVHNVFALERAEIEHLRTQCGTRSHSNSSTPVLNAAGRRQIAQTSASYALDDTHVNEAIRRRYGSKAAALQNRRTILHEALVKSYGPGAAVINVDEFFQWLRAALYRIIPLLGTHIEHDLEGLIALCHEPHQMGWKAIAKAPETMAPYLKDTAMEFIKRPYDPRSSTALSVSTMARLFAADASFLQALTELINDDEIPAAIAGLEIAACLDERSPTVYPPLLEALLRRLPPVAPLWKCRDTDFAAINTLKGAGRNQIESMDWLEDAYTTNPEFQTFAVDRVPGLSERESSKSLQNSYRGELVEALGYQTAFPQRAIPLLTDALDRFVEYDPDWGYDNGPHQRVARALERFGPDAAPALPKILDILDPYPRDEDFPKALLQVLWAMGDEAATAFSVVERLVGEPNEEEDPDAFYTRLGEDDAGCLLARLRRINGLDAS